MCQHTLRIRITFTAERFVIVKTEAIIKTLRFLLGHGDKSLTVVPERLLLIARYLEVRDDRAALILSGHNNERLLVVCRQGKAMKTCAHRDGEKKEQAAHKM
jgi:hypothetical protein